MVSYENHGSSWVKEKGKLKIKMDEGRCHSQNSQQDQRERRGSAQNGKKWCRLPIEWKIRLVSACTVILKVVVFVSLYSVPI